MLNIIQKSWITEHCEAWMAGLQEAWMAGLQDAWMAGLRKHGWQDSGSMNAKKAAAVSCAGQQSAFYVLLFLHFFTYGRLFIIP